MIAHRILVGDGQYECFACGVVVETVSDGMSRETFDYVPCRPGGWDHPPYLMPFADDSAVPLVETCAAHPYNDCTVYPLPTGA